MNNRLNYIFNILRGYTALYITTSICIFLFILFFQPFPIGHFDLNDSLIFEAGFGGIIFLLMIILQILFAYWSFSDKSWLLSAYIPIVRGFTLFALSSAAFAFYLRYVGGVYISFYIMMKILLICLAAPVVLRIYEIIALLRQQNDSLLNEKTKIEKRVKKFEEDYLNISVDFISEYGSEKFTLPIHEVAFIRSADNYVEIVYKETEGFKRKLIRNTLKGIEQQLFDYSNFCRCHRICIVNTHFIEKLHNGFGNHWIEIRGWEERIPVSRQYLLKVKELI